MIAVLAVASLLAGSATASQLSYSLPNTFPNLAKCASENLQYSCENTTVVTDSCCSIVQGGLVLQTQFWSTYTGLEKEGQLLPKGSWTIHGLWPDNCDGQYDVAPSPNKTDNGTVIPPYKGPSIDNFIKQYGRYELLEYMETYWINQGAPNWEFWGHEFSKHATCTSTFDVACYEPYKEHMDLINFFDAVIRAYKRYPTYDILASAGIVPSNKTTYPLAAIQNAVKAQVGAVPYFGCTNNGTVLSEVWYYHHVLGTEQYGTFKNLDTDYNSTCSTTAGIHYYERTSHSERVPHASALATCSITLLSFTMSDDEYGGGGGGGDYDYDQGCDYASIYQDFDERADDRKALARRHSCDEGFDAFNPDGEAAGEGGEEGGVAHPNGDAEMANGEDVGAGDASAVGAGLQGERQANKVRITTPYLTKYERARILGTRALQISMNAPVLVPLDGETDALQIAIKELSQRKIPLIIRRYLPDGSFEDWSVSELISD
ncbi:hypothetical protein HWV62_34837 [Athelia sp. TMB]|nr:hypothetical protein HWV62_34837 [Athelia sp. TMB]